MKPVVYAASEVKIPGMFQLLLDIMIKFHLKINIACGASSLTEIKIHSDMENL